MAKQKTAPNQIIVSTPGRICLFGEHQDYLGLPVIAAAISLRIRIAGRARPDRILRLHLPDIGAQLQFTANGRVPYVTERDYFRSGYNVLIDAGIPLPHGWDCVVRGEIPINSGTSSSSALMVSWIKFLLRAAGHPDGSEAAAVARLAHRAEVSEFNEPGGMMDHFATSFGGVIYLDFTRDEVERLAPALGTFVLGDSRQPKDTRGILAGVKQPALEAIALARNYLPGFDLRTTAREAARDILPRLPTRHAEVLAANLVDRDLLIEARQLLQTTPFEHGKFGQLLTAHHEQLSRHKRISTLKIDAMLDAALAAGALGGKINGSGGGGCMFAYAPQHAEAVADAIRAQGGVPHIVRVDAGARFEEI